MGRKRVDQLAEALTGTGNDFVTFFDVAQGKLLKMRISTLAELMSLEVAIPDDFVSSFNGQTGAVVLNSAGLISILTYTPQNVAQKNQASGYAGLDAGGKILTAQLPAVAISSFLGSVGSQAAMLALSGQEGDWAIRTDTGTTWILIGADPTQLSSWQMLATPTDIVSSVFGRTGAVIAQANDYSFAQLASKPTTLAGYGITDAQGLNALLTDIAALTDPNVDKIPFWDDSDGHIVWLAIGSGLSITGTTLSATGGGGTPGGSSGEIQFNNAGAFGGSLLKQAANLIEQRNAANRQTFRVYETYSGTPENDYAIEISNTGGTHFIKAKRLDESDFRELGIVSSYFNVKTGGNTTRVGIGDTVMKMRAAVVCGWTAGGADSGDNLDTGLARNAAGVVEINNGTPGTLRDVKVRTCNSATFTPSGSADSSGNVGDWAWDSDYAYVKTGAGWKRSALSTF